MPGEHCHLLITGGAGYIGTELARMALARGHAVTVADRLGPTIGPAERFHYVPFELAEPAEPGWLGAFDAVVHLAADTSSGPDRLPEDVETEAGIRLLEAASAQGCRFVFASSQSAAENAPAPYGRIKWRIEQAALARGGFVVRPGLVYGGAREAGVFGTLCRMVEGLPVLPDVRPRPTVQPVFVRDLCEAFLRLACGPDARPGAYNVGDPRGISFTGFLEGIARYRVRKTRLFLPAPMALFTALTRLRRVIPRFPDLGSERVLGLAALQTMDTQESLRRLALDPVPLPVGMVRGAAHARRFAAWEGRALLRYLSGRSPAPGLVKRYVRAVELRFSGVPLPLPIVFLRAPGMLCLLDSNPRLLDRFGWRDLAVRIGLAVALVEATPSGASQFLQLEPRSPLAAWMTLFGIVAKEALVRAAQLVYGVVSLFFPSARSGP